MDAAEALKDLTEISSQIEAAVLVTSEGKTLASTLDDEGAAERLSQAVRSLVDATAGAAGERTLVQLEAATSGGSLFVVTRRRAHRRGGDEARADGGARLLRPQELPARRRCRSR